MEETSSNRIVRRMASLPRSILGNFSRVMGQGIDLMGITSSRRRRHDQNLPLNFPPNIPQQQQQQPHHNPFVIQEEWAFLSSFEQNHGTFHPFFYACRFLEALKMARDERRLVFVYLHSPDHPFVPGFCRDTLCSEVVVEFLDANFVSWGGVVGRGDGGQVAETLRPSSFPFCAVVAPAGGDDMAVLQQIEGPVSSSELVEILQRTLEEEGLAFGTGARAKEEEKRRADRRLREEQDAAYNKALQIDKEKERSMSLSSGGQVERHVEGSSKKEKAKENGVKKQQSNVKEGIAIGSSRETQVKDTKNSGKEAQATQILIRFPNGERREHSFLCTEKLQAIYRYIDSLGLQGIGNYRLISSFPRKVFGVDQMGLSLKEAGLHPRASLFIELP